MYHPIRKLNLKRYSLFLFLPFIALAQGEPENFTDVYDIVMGILSSLVPLLWSASLLVFLWGLVKSINNSSNPGEYAKGKELMIWGVIALFVMTSIGGIVAFFGSSIGIDAVIPQFPE